MQPALYPGLLMLVLAWGSSSFLAIASTETTQPETNVLFRRFHSTKSDVNEVHMRKTPLLALLTLPVAPKRHAPYHNRPPVRSLRRIFLCNTTELHLAVAMYNELRREYCL